MQIANEWLENAKDRICQEIFNDPEVGKNCQISYSWPSKGAFAKKKQVAGQAWQQDGKDAIFISPILFKEKHKIKLLSTLIHELIHIEVGVDEGHGKVFKTAMKRIGLEGKVTESRAGKELEERLNGLELPKVPVLDFVGKEKKQTTRMKLVECGCQRKIRLSKKVLEEGGIVCKNCSTEFKLKEENNERL
jgi:predicted SprT family Zn-dependent metalloprotease